MDDLRVDHGDHDEVWTAGDEPDTYVAHYIEWHPGTPQANAEMLRARAQQALTGNRDYLATVSPTQAQSLAQVQALTRQVNALIRLTIGQLDSAD